MSQYGGDKCVCVFALGYDIWLCRIRRLHGSVLIEPDSTFDEEYVHENCDEVKVVSIS